MHLRFHKTRALGFPGSFTLLPDAPKALRVVKEGPGKLEESQRTLGTDQIRAAPWKEGFRQTDRTREGRTSGATAHAHVG